MKRLITLSLLLFSIKAGAAITFVNGSHADSSGVTSITPSEPTSCAEDDLIIAFVHWSQNTTDAITDPADFTQLDDFTETTGTDTRTYIGYKVRGADEGSGYQFSKAGTGGRTQANLLCFSGVDTTTPLDVTYVKATHYNATQNNANTAAPAITTITDNAWVVIGQMHTAALSNTNGAPSSGYTELFEAALGQNEDGFYSQRKEIASATLETPGDFTHTDTNNTTDPRKFTLALKPASAGGKVDIFNGKFNGPFGD